MSGAHLSLLLLRKPGLQEPDGARKGRRCSTGGRVPGLLIRLVLVVRLLWLQRQVPGQTARRHGQGAVCSSMHEGLSHTAARESSCILCPNGSENRQQAYEASVNAVRLAQQMIHWRNLSCWLRVNVFRHVTRL